MTIQKHEATPRKKKQQPPAQPPAPPAAATMLDINIGTVAGIETILERIAHTLKSYHVNACDGNLALALFTDPSEGAYPMRLQLEGEAVDKIADALARIATALEVKASG